MESGQIARLVFIDDNKDMASVYARILKLEGLEAQFFLDHESALESLTSRKLQPEVVFLDFLIPGRSAEDFISALEEKLPSYRKNFRLYIFSSLPPDSPQLAGIESRCDGFREKPMDIEGFLRTIKSCLEN